MTARGVVRPSRATLVRRCAGAGEQSAGTWPNETDPALRARTDEECAAAEQKATGIIAMKSEPVT